MDSPYSSVIEELRASLAGAAQAAGYDVTASDVSVDSSKAFGDFTSTLAMKLAKKLNRKPDDVANSITAKLKLPEGVDGVDAKNGFLNFSLNRPWFSQSVIDYISEKEGKNLRSTMGKGKSVTIEYPSVNPNKPWHIGHLRCALIGDVIANLLIATGHETEREDYIDDLGLQMAEIVWWHSKSKHTQEGKFDQWLGKEYVDANKFMAENDVKAEIANTLKLMEQDGTYEEELGRSMAEQCVRAQYETAFDYRIYHDIMIWESDILRAELLTAAMEILEKKQVAKKIVGGKFDGCFGIDLNDVKQLPNELKGMKESIKVLIRSDSTPAYLAKDIAFHMWKLGIIEASFKTRAFIEEQPNGKPVQSTGKEGKEMRSNGTGMAINVIGAAQEYPQMLLKLAIEAVSGKKDVIKHLAYGEVELESGALSGRKGTWIGFSADDLFREARQMASTQIKERFTFSDEEHDKIATSVALAAIRFEYLRLGPEKKLVFSWERALSFEGSSGPYVQYTYARASRIVEGVKAGKPAPTKGLFGTMTDTEFTLVKMLSNSREVLEKATAELRPNSLCEYLIELSLMFSRFYEQSPILKAESEELRRSRTAILIAFRAVVGQMLEVLGIDPLEKM
ncbi:MAG TPA: arginine--tRNA ligase [Candidatus Baltobacteraceae bacterium]|nr:arginine--tRNA ligase [Candidatus Baltobacteraceae bacterium]